MRSMDIQRTAFGAVVCAGLVLLGCEAADRSDVASLRAAAERLPHEENWAESEVAGLLVRRWEAGDEIAPRYLPLFDENGDG